MQADFNDFRHDWQKWSHVERVSAVLLSTLICLAPLALHVL